MPTEAEKGEDIISDRRMEEGWRHERAKFVSGTASSLDWLE